MYIHRLTTCSTDAEEFVVEKVLNTYASLAELDLFSKMKLWELIGIIAPLICHPSVWIRHGKWYTQWSMAYPLIHEDQVLLALLCQHPSICQKRISGVSYTHF